MVFISGSRPPRRAALFPYTTLFRSDWPLLNALVNTAAGATWVSIHHGGRRDRKSTRLNSSHVKISYAVFCLKKKIATPVPQPATHAAVVRIVRVAGPKRETTEPRAL